jgi:uncharacterized membrane protein
MMKISMLFESTIMFTNLINTLHSNSSGVRSILEFIDLASVAIEVLAVVIIIFSVVATTWNYIFLKSKPIDEDERYLKYKTGLGRSLLLGLEVLIAADVVRTVALDATIESITVLGLLVVIRTFLSWSLVVEIEGHWPWQAKKIEKH